MLLSGVDLIVSPERKVLAITAAFAAGQIPGSPRMWGASAQCVCLYVCPMCGHEKRRDREPFVWKIIVRKCAIIRLQASSFPH